MKLSCEGSEKLVNINHRQVVMILKSIANDEFKEKKPNRVEIRRIKTYAIFPARAKSLVEWLRNYAQYLMCSYYPNMVRVYFLGNTGHMYSAITLEDEEMRVFIEKLKKKTRLIYSIKEIEPQEPTLEELAQKCYIILSKTIRYIIEETGISKGIDIPPIRVEDKNSSEVGFLGCKITDEEIAIAKQVCREPILNLIVKYISYYLILPTTIREDNELTKILAYSFTLIHLTHEEIKQINKLARNKIEKIPIKREYIKSIVKMFYLIERYERSVLDRNTLISVTKVAGSKKLQPLEGIKRIYNMQFQKTKKDEYYVKEKIVDFLLDNLTTFEIQPKDFFSEIASDIVNYRLSKITKETLNENKLLEDAFYHALSSGLDITVSYSELDPDEDWILKFNIKNKADINVYNIKFERIKWIPKNALKMKNELKSIEMLPPRHSERIEIAFIPPTVKKVKFREIIVYGQTERDYIIKGTIPSFTIFFDI